MIVAILAGGTSTRFGGDKQFYKLKGQYLVDIVYEKVSVLGFPTYIVTTPDRFHVYKSMGYSVIKDTYAMGPIGGILSALEVDSALVVGSDMPCVEPMFLKQLILSSRRGRYTAVPFYSKKGFLEPLHGIWSRCIFNKLRDYVISGGKQIQWFLYKHTWLYRSYPVKSCWELNSFYNINTREDINDVPCF